MNDTRALAEWKRLKLQMLCIVYRDQNGDLAVLNPDRVSNVAMFGQESDRPRTVYEIARAEEAMDAAEAAVAVAERIGRPGAATLSLADRIHEVRMSNAREDAQAV